VAGLVLAFLAKAVLPDARVRVVVRRKASR